MVLRIMHLKIFCSYMHHYRAIGLGAEDKATVNAFILGLAHPPHRWQKVGAQDPPPPQL